MRLSISSLAAPGNDCPYSVERAPIWCFSVMCIDDRSEDHDCFRTDEFVTPLLSVGRPSGCEPTLASKLAHYRYVRSEPKTGGKNRDLVGPDGQLTFNCELSTFDFFTS
jgi:hypothetical protein